MPRSQKPSTATIILVCTDTGAEGQNEDLHSFLQSGPALSRTDDGCGFGWSTESVLVDRVSRKKKKDWEAEPVLPCVAFGCSR